MSCLSGKETGKAQGGCDSGCLVTCARSPELLWRLVGKGEDGSLPVFRAQIIQLMLTPNTFATVSGSEITMSHTKYVLKFQDGQTFPLNFQHSTTISIGRRESARPQPFFPMPSCRLCTRAHSMQLQLQSMCTLQACCAAFAGI